MFTAETAAFYAKKSHAPESARHRSKTAMPSATLALQEVADPLATDLLRVQEQLVQKMLAVKGDSESIPKLARSFRDVREAYHLVTGQAKPGVIRETGRSSRQRSQAKPQPLPDDGPPDQ